MAKAKTLKRSELLTAVADRSGMAKKEVVTVYEHTLRAIQDAVRSGQTVALTGFGRFTQRTKKARKAGMARNPFTGEMVKVAAKPASKLPRFSPAKQFKDYVSGSIRALPAMPGAKKAAPKKKKAAARKPAKKKTSARRR
ncbi:MAG: HU family DNA-binding protein [Actinomycetota bacterium]